MLEERDDIQLIDRSSTCELGSLSGDMLEERDYIQSSGHAGQGPKPESGESQHADDQEIV